MTVVGIDFGSLASKIGVARRGGIDIITNEVSNRATPSLISFGVKQRSIGEAAKTQETSNFKNTIGSLKRLLGRSSTDPEITEIESKFINAQLVDANGSTAVKVNYRGEPTVFTSTQLAAMYFGKLRDIASKELKGVASDVVIAVPGWYTETQRRAALDAAAIAGLNTLRLINDTTATALGYGITKSDLPAEGEKPRHVVFVDVGHSNLSAAVVAFNKGQLHVKSTAYDRHLGGRDIDYALVQFFAAQFKEKYKIDVLSSPKAVFRLVTGCERLKKVLSANAEAILNVENIMNDVDASSKLSRDELEVLISGLLERVAAPIKAALAEAGLAPEDVDAVELVGGSTRVPSIKARIQAIFPGKTLSFTLNQDEAIARGATFACAMLSPVFRVRDFAVHDINPYPIKVTWAKSPADPDEDTELLVFPRGNALPSSKILTFYRNGPFEVEASYAEPSTLPGAVNPWIGRFSAKGVEVPASGDLAQVKVKTRLNIHGVLEFASSHTEELIDKEETSMEVDGEAPAAEGEKPKKKKALKKKDVPFVVGTTGLEPTLLDTFKEQEAQMHASDKLVMDTEDRKNALEEYVYDTRGKLDERYAAFVQPAEKQQLLVALQEAEDWLYTEEGEDATKSAYVSKLDALKALGEPIANRYREAEERPRAMSQLRETINTFLSQATSDEERYSHIDTKDKQAIVEKCATAQKWLDDQSARQAERPKNVDPVFTAEEMKKKREEIVYFASPILSRPKPKPKVEATGGTETPPPKGTQTPDPAANGAEPEAKPEMDVD
ncbi:heat shock protein 70 [Sistotremastrum niveocremeum HHB9708]|uniref:Heat shock protein 70 n=2 Tax=Sistotremastraceae TaxID=3402574 RepID=A0A165A585_9AGAM|nr:heat shock protein 70 [Sistotremastrum niveocremeum HHB9708]KZT43574.1 heat shock protein 70 [Sistotremastrum suecicum HHB10207 ss-3]